jgi:hypothetical protein
MATAVSEDYSLLLIFHLFGHNLQPKFMQQFNDRSQNGHAACYTDGIIKGHPHSKPSQFLQFSPA